MGLRLLIPANQLLFHSMKQEEATAAAAAAAEEEEEEEEEEDFPRVSYGNAFAYQITSFLINPYQSKRWIIANHDHLFMSFGVIRWIFHIGLTFRPSARLHQLEGGTLRRDPDDPSLSQQLNIFDCGFQDANPIRPKSMNYINTPAAFNKVNQVMAALMSAKMKERVNASITDSLILNPES